MRPWTLRLWPGPGHFDASGHSQVLSLPPAPGPLPPPPPNMATSSEPGCERLDADSDKQTSSLTDIMAAMTTKDSDSSAANGVRNGGAQQEGAQVKRTRPLAPHLTGRKLSLQERGTYMSSGGGYTHSSPRVARRPTVESKRVSISDSQVRKLLLFIFYSNKYSYIFLHDMNALEIIDLPSKTRIWCLKLKSEVFQPRSSDFGLQTWISAVGVTGGFIAGSDTNWEKTGLLCLWEQLSWFDISIIQYSSIYRISALSPRKRSRRSVENMTGQRKHEKVWSLLTSVQLLDVASRVAHRQSGAE